MIAKNSNMFALCVACLNFQGTKKVVDTFFENGSVVILSRCQVCGGITKHTYRAESQGYVTGPRKSLLQRTETKSP